MCMGYKVVKSIYVAMNIFIYEVTANGTPMQWFEFLSKAFNRIGRMTSALISCMLNLDFCIFFSAQKKVSWRFAQLQKECGREWWTAGSSFFLDLFSPFASSMFLSFSFELWHLAGKEFNNVCKISSTTLRIGEHWLFAIHLEYCSQLID